MSEAPIVDKKANWKSLHIAWLNLEAILKDMLFYNPLIADVRNSIPLFQQEINDNAIQRLLSVIYATEKWLKESTNTTRPFLGLNLKTTSTTNDDLNYYCDLLLKRLMNILDYLTTYSFSDTPSRVKKPSQFAKTSNFFTPTRIRQLIIISGVSFSIMGIIFIFMMLFPGLGFQRTLIITDYVYIMIVVGSGIWLFGQFLPKKLHILENQLITDIICQLAILLIYLAVLSLVFEHHDSQLQFIFDFRLPTDISVGIFFLLGFLLSNYSLSKSRTIINIVSVAVIPQFTLLLMCMEYSNAFFVISILIIVMYSFLWVNIFLIKQHLLAFIVIIGSNLLCLTAITHFIEPFLVFLFPLFSPILVFLALSKTTISEQLFKQKWIVEWYLIVPCLNSFILCIFESKNIVLLGLTNVSWVWWIIICAEYCTMFFLAGSSKSSILGAITSLMVAWGPCSWYLGLLHIDLIFSIVPLLLVVLFLSITWLTAKSFSFKMINFPKFNEWLLNVVIFYLAIAFCNISWLYSLLLLSFIGFFIIDRHFIFEYRYSWCFWCLPYIVILLTSMIQARMVVSLSYMLITLTLLSAENFLLLTFTRPIDIRTDLPVLRKLWLSTSIGIFCNIGTFLLLNPTIWILYYSFIHIIMLMYLVTAIINNKHVDYSFNINYATYLPILAVILYVGKYDSFFIFGSWLFTIFISIVNNYRMDSNFSLGNTQRKQVSTSVIQLRQNTRDIYTIALLFFNCALLLTNPDWIIQSIILLSIPVLEIVNRIFPRNKASELPPYRLEIPMLGVFIENLLLLMKYNINLLGSPFGDNYPIIIIIVAWICFYFLNFKLSYKDYAIQWKSLNIDSRWLSGIVINLYIGIGISLRLFDPLIAVFLLCGFVLCQLCMQGYQSKTLSVGIWILIMIVSYYGLYSTFTLISSIHYLFIDLLAMIYLPVILSSSFSIFLALSKIPLNKVVRVIIIGILGLTSFIIFFESLTFQQFDMILYSLSLVSISAIMVIYLLKSLKLRLSISLEAIQLFVIPIWVAIIACFGFIISLIYGLNIDLNLQSPLPVLIVLIIVGIFAYYQYFICKNTPQIPLGYKIMFTIDLLLLQCSMGLLVYIIFSLNDLLFNITLSTIATSSLLIACLISYRPNYSLIHKDMIVYFAISGTLLFTVVQTLLPMSSLFTLWWFLVVLGSLIIYYQSNEKISLYIASLPFAGGVIKLLLETLVMLSQQRIDIVTAFTLIFVGILLVTIGYQFTKKIDQEI